MYHDYDILVKTLLEISLQYEFRKRITGTDIHVFYRENRKKIELINSREAFYRFIRSVITANQDPHTSVLRTDYPMALFKQFGVSDSAISNLKGYTYFYNKINNGNHLNFQFRYIDGRYYNVVPFTYRGKYYKSGLEITTCNGLPINQYVNSLYPYLVMKWDFVHHTYFADAFFQKLQPVIHRPFDTTTLKDDAAPRRFMVGDSVMLANKAVAVAPKVKKFIWFADQKILYIRMPAMEIADTDYYANEILKYRDYKINKIVIDIRDNGGGSDYVWRRLVSNIITEPIIYNVVTLANS